MSLHEKRPKIQTAEEFFSHQFFYHALHTYNYVFSFCITSILTGRNQTFSFFWQVSLFLQFFFFFFEKHTRNNQIMLIHKDINFTTRICVIFCNDRTQHSCSQCMMKRERGRWGWPQYIPVFHSFSSVMKDSTENKPVSYQALKMR